MLLNECNKIVEQYNRELTQQQWLNDAVKAFEVHFKENKAYNKYMTIDRDYIMYWAIRYKPQERTIAAVIALEKELIQKYSRV